MSDRPGIIEGMFELRLPDAEVLRGLDDAGLVDTIRRTPSTAWSFLREIGR